LRHLRRLRQLRLRQLRRLPPVPPWHWRRRKPGPRTAPRVWVALAFRDSGRVTQVHFDGYPISETAVPPPGSVLTSRYAIPIWTEPQMGANDPSKGAGQIQARACVLVLSTTKSTGRLWAEVVSHACP
jgi:hypothetical protein